MQIEINEFEIKNIYLESDFMLSNKSVQEQC